MVVKMDFTELKKRIDNSGLSYITYVDKNIDEIANTNPDNLSQDEQKRFNFKKLNLQRSSRISRTYNVSEELKQVIKQITELQLWMIITENWCGDSAQNLPHISAAAKENTLIDLRILLRDSNPEVMDQFLTKGTRSIPILVAFNESGEEIFRWGPRPETAVDLIKQWKEEGLEKPERTEKLHLWYSRNKGQDLEAELVYLIKKSQGVLSENL